MYSNTAQILIGKLYSVRMYDAGSNLHNAQFFLLGKKETLCLYYLIESIVIVNEDNTIMHTAQPTAGQSGFLLRRKRLCVFKFFQSIIIVMKRILLHSTQQDRVDSS